MPVPPSRNCPASLPWVGDGSDTALLCCETGPCFGAGPGGEGQTALGGAGAVRPALIRWTGDQEHFQRCSRGAPWLELLPVPAGFSSRISPLIHFQTGGFGLVGLPAWRRRWLAGMTRSVTVSRGFWSDMSSADQSAWH